jgi:hypothetical protein
MSAEEVVRAFFDCYTSGRPEDFDQVVAADYVDYGHTPPGHGPGGARDDYEHAIGLAGGVIRYEIDALVTDGDGGGDGGGGGDTVAAVWTGTMPNGSQYRGLSLYTAPADCCAPPGTPSSETAPPDRPARPPRLADPGPRASHLHCESHESHTPPVRTGKRPGP